MPEDLLTQRKSLDEICAVPDKIISVYSLEKHVWANSNSDQARRARQPELKTIDEFKIDPVRPFLTDILRRIAAPYDRQRKEQPIGQGYWIQAEFGSGKSHLLCFLASLALGTKDAWQKVQEKESKAGKGKRESLFQFWEEGIQSKSAKPSRGLLVIVKTLVGVGGGTIGMTDQGRELSAYILDAAKDQLLVETGKNLSLYPAELLADRLLKEVDRHRNDLRKFLKDPRFFEEDEFEEVDNFIRDIQQNKSPEYKRSCGNKLWRFYTEYLDVHPNIAAETEAILKHLVETITAEGYAGVLLILDEVSLFMKNRPQAMRDEDEKTLVVLANRLAKIHNLPIWTVCAAQQAIESKMGVKNIIADDRLKLVKLLEEDKDYYDIVLSRVREITNEQAIGNYYLFYKRGFTWPQNIGEKDFKNFFPFHRPALEVLRAITYELTTARSAIHFMHQTLKHQVKVKGRELIRLWELFDEAVRYEEDPSGVTAGLVAIKTKRESEYRAYEQCKRQIEGLSKGTLKVNHDKAVKILQTLFLYHIARTNQSGLTAEELANSVLIERKPDATPQENIEHYEALADSLKKELRQVAMSTDEDGNPRYRFDPVVTGVDPNSEFKKARDEAEANEVLQQEAWNHLLALDEWPVRTRQMTFDMAGGVRSIFRDIAPFIGTWEDKSTAKAGDQSIDITWQGRQISGTVGMRDALKLLADNHNLPELSTDQTHHDFAAYISTKTVSDEVCQKLLSRRNDPRVLLWAPADLTSQERDRLIDFAAYRKLVSDWQNKDTEEAVAVIAWVNNTLKTEMGPIAKIVENSYARGRIDALNNSKMPFKVVGELGAVLSPLVERVLNSVYESRDIVFDPPFIFRKEEGVKVINGIVRTGRIPKGIKPNQDISAAQNFGYGLKIMRKGADKDLDTTQNPHAQDIWQFIDEKLTDEGAAMKMDALYKNFMGIGGHNSKNYGLTQRMVQIFALCLVQQGKIRISLGPKSGLPNPYIDYSNLAETDFSVKVLDSLGAVQKMAKPEHWEVLRPYAEKLLAENIPTTHDDAIISGFRAKLKNLFAKGKEESTRVLAKAQALFDCLKSENPYAKEISQVARLFSADLSSGNDINLILHALKDAFAYQAFDDNASSQAEVDDLANRLKNYRDTQNLLQFDTELRAASAYVSHALPDAKDLKAIRDLQTEVAAKLAKIRTYIDSDVALATELIGQTPPAPGEASTVSVLIRDYTETYATLHDTVTAKLEDHRSEIESTPGSAPFKALQTLEGITALKPPVSGSFDFQALAGRIRTCPSPSRQSVEQQLRNGPVHECGLTFENAKEHLNQATQVRCVADALLTTALDRKAEVFLNPAIRTRLEQGKQEKPIAELLTKSDLTALREFLVANATLQFVQTINRYLKNIVTKNVSLTEFKPSLTTIEPDQAAKVVKEFQEFLEQQFKTISEDNDTLPMLHFE
ncbi:conserved hypothetical protein [Verrucomicrobia bacterium]|nr:conserved hypothetical protein [Verrucomicrobiota bacterium]